MRLMLLAPLALLGACNSSADKPASPDPELATEAAAPPAPAPTPTPALTAMVPPVAPQTPSAAVTANEIPLPMRGRWGLVKADCEPGRDDAKGLMVVGPRKLEFYESVGTLATITSGTDSSIRGTFAFTGEGMEWTRDQTLAVQDGGKVLIRQEFGQDAAPAPFTYSKCA
ncbi:MAG: hypothetical protein RLZZ08_981 [Pseudomonadota bacterium]